MILGDYMKNKVQKRYIYLILIVVLVCILIWRISASYASVNQGYQGKNIVSGDKWGVNITKVGEVERKGQAELVGEISTIGTTLNFNTVLFHPGDQISFEVEVENTSNLPAELYALTLTGLNDIDSENVTYTILPVDGSFIHSEKTSGSIIKSGEKQRFNITISYDDVGPSNGEYHLSLGSTIIYKQS